ncbi:MULTISPECIES: DUF6248 family natural product biosynthesis protein [unclassified Streptomyces]|uniref:DUF6248 family natural product biosynthesis protein n=1 Tax=unclassified Streptomyces TaxID=2593676 RepID=UPI0036F086A2
MTTRLRHIGAAIMGILDPIPSTTTSPMTEEEGAWVRAHPRRRLCQSAASTAGR